MCWAEATPNILPALHLAIRAFQRPFSCCSCWQSSCVGFGSKRSGSPRVHTTCRRNLPTTFLTIRIRENVIESWEWELDILVDAKFHHPTNDRVDRYTAAIYFREPVDRPYDLSAHAPSYLVDGFFSKSTGIYEMLWIAVAVHSSTVPVCTICIVSNQPGSMALMPPRTTWIDGMCIVANRRLSFRAVFAMTGVAYWCK